MPVLRLNRGQSKVMRSKALDICFAGGWGNGKTTVGIHKTLQHCKEHGDEANVLLLRQTMPEIRDTLLPEFDKICPKSLIRRKVDFPHPERTLINGAHIKMRYIGDSSKQNAQLEHLSGINASLIVIDQAEEVSEKAWMTLQGRMRGGSKEEGTIRQILLLCNMAKNWIWRNFKLKKIPDTELIEASTYENWANLPEDTRRRFERLSPKWFQRYIIGNWDAFSGNVWDLNEQHLIRGGLSFDDLISVEGLYGGMDYALNSPSCFLLGAHLAGDILVILWEVYIIDLLSEFKRQIDAKLSPNEAFALGATYADPTIWGKTQQPAMPATFQQLSKRVRKKKKWSIADMMKKDPHSLYVTRANNDRLFGLNKVGELLKVDPDLINPFTGERGSPRLFLNVDGVPNLIDEIATYEFADVELQDEVPVSGTTKTKKTPDHGADTMRYLAATGPWRSFNTGNRAQKTVEGASARRAFIERITKRSYMTA